jgi:uncharacterized protein
MTPLRTEIEQSLWNGFEFTIERLFFEEEASPKKYDLDAVRKASRFATGGSPAMAAMNRRTPKGGSPARNSEGVREMSTSQNGAVGRILEIWRYPVKSMLGEKVTSSHVTERGLAGDRAYALLDTETGKVVSAKNPRRWPNMFEFHSAYPESPAASGAFPRARITCPDGESLSTYQPDIDSRLSAILGRPVRLEASSFTGASSEGYWPEWDWVEAPGATFQFPLPPGTFFDCAMVHLLTTATLAQLHELTPASRFAIPRFRPNLVIETPGEAHGFVERPSSRCVMTTLSQSDLPKDPQILRTLVQANAGNCGVYATVIKGGRIADGDEVAVR